MSAGDRESVTQAPEATEATEETEAPETAGTPEVMEPREPRETPEALAALAASTGPAAPPVARVVPMWNVANLLTLSRLVLVPLFVAALFYADHTGDVYWRYVAAAVFAIAALTDRVDGWVARKYELVTDFGKIADPIADKALIGAALVGLSLLGELPWWVTIVIAARELAVTLLRFWVLRYGVIPASRGGKAKTLAQVVAIALYLVPLPDGADVVRWVVLGIALVLTVATGLDYVVRALRLRAASPGPAAARPADPGDGDNGA